MSKKEDNNQVESYRISDIDQIKALAHPLRMRIVEALAESDPMTTKQVAESLGEKPTRLYHHVDILQKAGLLRLTHTRQNRGTTEKYYEAIARQFRADEGLFSDEISDEDKSALRPMIRTIFDNTMSELLRLVDANDPGDKLEEEGMLSYLEVHLSQEHVDEVQRRLMDVLKYLENLDDAAEDDAELRKYRLTIANYPLDRFD